MNMQEKIKLTAAEDWHKKLYPPETAQEFRDRMAAKDPL